MYFFGLKHKSAIWDGTPPPAHQTYSICVEKGSGITNLQMEFNYLDPFMFYSCFIDFGFFGSKGADQVGGEGSV